MDVHPLRFGSIRVKEAHYRGRGQSRAVRTLRWALDPNFHDPLPILGWVIDHPEGPIVVDTGERAAASLSSYYPPLARWFYRWQFQVDVAPEDELDPQLRRLGFDPDDVATVVLTHAHFDHVDGLCDVPDAEVVCSRREYEDAMAGGARYGTLREHLPANFAPTCITFDGPEIGPFSASHHLAHGVFLVPTPGHTHGHLSVVVDTGDGELFLAGDAAFDQQSLLARQVDGVAMDADTHRETQRRILRFVAERPTVVLPSHDPDAPRRLREHEFCRVPPDAVPATKST
ncbi:N-acyl homoserine lactonase family protein [Haloarchaeobius sp. TZWSO28]|uniref:N-acyl homoserine lactonase family protein n=1 Tax=Haloarchaeobius sp. TZWSO28 TaxID=3446119 RepID=UPI003EBAA614